MRIASILLLLASVAPWPGWHTGAARATIAADASVRPTSMALRAHEPRVLLQGTVLFLSWSLERDDDDGPVWITLRDYDRAHVLFEWSVSE
jgi:hypothetical protein